MKKMLSLLVAMMMLFACGIAAAEDLDLSAADPALSGKVFEMPDLGVNQNSFAAVSTDIVSKSGNIYTVIAPECIYMLNPSCFPSSICFTQDMSVSFEAFLACADPNAQYEFMIKNNIHYIVYDFETDLEIMIYNLGSSAQTTMIGDFNSLSAENRSLYAMANGMDECKEIGGRWWACGTDGDYGIFFTIVNGNYVQAQCHGKSLKDDVADMESLLAGLVLR